MKNKKINLAMMAGMILMGMGCEAKGKASQNSISGKYNVETLTTKGQTVKVAGQKCFEDSYFEIKGNIAYISLNNVVNGNCITKAGTYDMQSKGNGRYILVGNGKESDEIIVKNGKVQYNQDTGISMTFSKDVASTLENIKK